MESIKKYFKVGIVQFMAYPAPKDAQEQIRDFKKTLSDDYFDAIELTHIADESTSERVRAMVRQSHITPCYGAQPRLLGGKLNPNDPDEAKRQAAEKVLMESIDEAERMGCGGIAFLSGHWDESTRDECYRQLLKTTGNLCAYAATKRMAVELEVFDYDVDKKSLIGPAPYAARFAADMRMRYNNFGLMLDLSHLPLTYEDSLFAIRVLKPYITHLHIGNAVAVPGAEAYGDMHPRFGFENGANDVQELLGFLRALRQEGLFSAENPMILSFEVKPWKDEDPDLVVANAKRVLNRAWAML